MWGRLRQACSAVIEPSEPPTAPASVDLGSVSRLISDRPSCFLLGQLEAVASPLTQGAGKRHKIRVNGNPGFPEPGDPVFLPSFRWQGGGSQGRLLQLAAVSSGGRFGVSWAGLALITGSGRLPHLIRLLGTKTRCLAGRKEGSWGLGEGL